MTHPTTHSTEILLLETSAVLDAVASVNEAISSSEETPNAINIGSQFVEVARQFSDQPALSTATGSLSYRDLLSSAIAVSLRLRQRATFQPGARVVLLLPNSWEYIAAFYGTLLAGGVVVPLSPKTERSQLLNILESTSAAHILTQTRFSKPWLNELDDPRAERISLTESLSGQKDSRRHDQSPDVNLAAILFTGGSSGKPKGVMLSHRNLAANAESIQQYLQIESTDRPLCILPFQHAFGNSVLQSHLLAGAHLILDGNPTFPETMIDAIDTHRATSLSGVPDLFRFLLERTSLDPKKLRSLRYMAVAGGNLPHDLAIQLSNRICPAKFFVMYGQTEATARLAYVPPERIAELGEGCIGRAVPGVELQIVDDQGIEVAPGVIGEIRARGSNIMQGYWRDPHLTNQTIRDGWLHTGDLGSMNPDGWVHHRGRLNALIKIAGYRIHPSDVEEFVIRNLPILQAVAVPYELPGVGTKLALFVRSHAETLTATQIISCCRNQLPRHMVPDLIQFVHEFPLNEAMKIDRPGLIRLAAVAATQRRTAV